MSIKNNLLKIYKPLLFITFFIFLLNGCKKDEEIEEGPDKESSIIDPNSMAIANVDTKNLTIVDEPKIPANLQITEEDSILFDGPIGIEIRGSSSQMFPKKSYGFETWDEDGKDINVSLADFPEEEDWIFYAPYSDKSLIRNVIIFELSNEIGQYATKTKFLELYLNNKYSGLYVLMEKIKRDKNRVNISKNKDDDLTGGYILKIDKSTGDGSSSADYNNQNSFSSKYNSLGTTNLNNGAITHFLYEYPDSDDINENQKNYIINYISQFEDTLISSEFNDPEKGYSKFIDIDSFIDFFLLNEISKNIDGYRLSTFMHKNKGEKLKMGPIWDFNLGFGNANYCNGDSYEGWAYQFNNQCPGDLWQVPFWWKRFMEDHNWKNLLKTRWTSLRNDQFSNDHVLNKISNHVKFINENNSSSDNFTTWDILGKYIWPNAYNGSSYSDEIAYLNSWIKNRLNWMDSKINSF
ncbi:MAG: CotH kinase family protein [Flavobacteriaceae bacterium]|nr:CotH kinase family protein [Flavobacteriaceae bacterium]